MIETSITSKQTKREELREQKQKVGFTNESDYLLEVDKSEKSKAKYEKVTQLDISKPYKYWQLLELCLFKYFNNTPKSKRIRQVFNIFRTNDDKEVCMVGLTNKYIYKDQLLENHKYAQSDVDKLQILDKQEKIERVYENLLFETEIKQCPMCDIFDLDKVYNKNKIRILKQHDSSIMVRDEKQAELTEVKYDKSTKKLVNLLQHLNDIHKLKFTKILNIIKKYDY